MKLIKNIIFVLLILQSSVDAAQQSKNFSHLNPGGNSVYAARTDVENEIVDEMQKLIAEEAAVPYVFNRRERLKRLLLERIISGTTSQSQLEMYERMRRIVATSNTGRSASELESFDEFDFQALRFTGGDPFFAPQMGVKGDPAFEDLPDESFGEGRKTSFDSSSSDRSDSPERRFSLDKSFYGELPR